MPREAFQFIAELLVIIAAPRVGGHTQIREDAMRFDGRHVGFGHQNQTAHAREQQRRIPLQRQVAGEVLHLAVMPFFKPGLVSLERLYALKRNPFRVHPIAALLARREEALEALIGVLPRGYFGCDGGRRAGLWSACGQTENSLF